MSPDGRSALLGHDQRDRNSNDQQADATTVAQVQGVGGQEENEPCRRDRQPALHFAGGTVDPR